MMMGRKWISICLASCLLALSACGSVESVADEVIELKEPVDGEVGWLTEKVIRRNLYMVTKYEAAVYPEIREYSFDVRQTFESYGAMLGDTVAPGDVLLQADTESLDTRIENFEERLKLLTENYEKYKTKALQTISDKTWNVGYYEEIFNNLTDQEPEEYITDANGKKKENPAHAKWEKEWNKWVGESNKNELDLWVAQDELELQTELYNLDYAYYSAQLKDLKAQLKSAVLKSDIAGEVVGMSVLAQGDSISAETAVAAVADMSKLSVQCEYIPRRNIVYYAKEYYAFVNGVRYELVYDDNGATDRTTFHFADENVDVKAGDYAVVVLETNSREQVIAVRKDALYVDSSGHYVYVIENEETVQKNVKIGVSDGVYTEIVSGLEEGEAVLVTDVEEAVNTATLEKGAYTKTLTKTGSLTYPVTFSLKNPIEYGKVFFQGYLVENFQYVEAGQPIAQVRVEGDRIELARLETELQRAKERLEDLKALVTEENAESYADRIEREQEAVDEQEEKLTKMRADYDTVEICAEKSGVILALIRYDKEQSLNSTSVIARFANPNYGYLALENATNLSYGDELTITYTNASRQQVSSQATVVTMGTPGVSAKLDNGYKYLKISDEVLADMLEALKKTGGGYNMSKIKGTGEILSMKNVVLVPKEATTAKDGVTYVNVLQEDGNVIPVSFLAGGSDNKYYWVIEGLTEGMTICWE